MNKERLYLAMSALVTGLFFGSLMDNILAGLFMFSVLMTLAWIKVTE